MQKLLIIGYIWPEPKRTAAGYRMLQLIDLFIDKGYTAVFCSAAKIKSTSDKPLSDRNIPMIPITLNSDDLDELLLKERPDIVLYDRFLVEEQFGWRVRKVVPRALQILDTEDLHFLRIARQKVVEEGETLASGLSGELAMREISSMLRVDMNLIISGYEMELLESKYGFEKHRIFYLPFLIKKEEVEMRKLAAVAFENREGFCTIGNLKHAPNLDAVRQLQKLIWPQIRKQLPDAQLYVYGSNAPREVLEMNDPDTGFHVKGHAASVDQVLSKHRLLFAPLRYGAGLKGKIFDAMKNGIPCVMTEIAAEAMFVQNLSPGLICDLENDFAHKSSELYSDAASWNVFQSNGFKILQDAYEESAFAKAVFLHIHKLENESPMERSFLHKMLLHHADAHFKFMNYWIKSKS